MARTWDLARKARLCAFIFAIAPSGLACNSSSSLIDLGVDSGLSYIGSPVISEGFTVTPAVVKVVAGDSHSCALYNTGAVKCWGRDNLDQLGDGGGADSDLPVAVAGVSGAIDLYAGADESCAILADRTVTCWGDGSGPADAGLRSAQALSIGGGHACALTTAGAVLCWGAGARGQLGDGSAAASATPVAATGYPSSATGARLAAGNRHSCVIDTDGAIQCFGDDSSGELGDASATALPVSSPVAAGTLVGYDVAAGLDFSCAIDADTAEVYCWGDDSTNALGDGLATAVDAPQKLAGLYSAGLASGPTAGHVCSLAVTVSGAQLLGPPGDTTTDPEVDTEGKIQCWGSNGSGQLGNNAVAASADPVFVTGMIDALQVAVGGAHSCALLHSGAVKCWGSSLHGQLGHGDFADSHVPEAVAGL